MTKTNFRFEVVHTRENNTIGPRNQLEQGMYVQYVVKFDEGGRTFQDGPFSCIVAGPNWQRDAETKMADTRNALEGFYRHA